MKSIENEIIECIKTSNDFTYTNLEVIEPYSYKEPDFNKIIIVVQEIQNTPNERTFTDKEEYSELGYQISILSRLQRISNENGEVRNASPYEVTRTMYFELVDKLYEEFLLTRVGDPLVRPYSADDTVLERVFRVANTIDLEHEYLYRR